MRKDLYAPWRDFWIRLSPVRGPHETKDIQDVCLWVSAFPYWRGVAGGEADVDLLIAHRVLAVTAEEYGLDSTPFMKAIGLMLWIGAGPFRGFKCDPEHPWTWPPAFKAAGAYSGHLKPSKVEAAALDAGLLLVNRIAFRTEAAGKTQGGGVPDDLITSLVAERDYEVARKTLYRHITDGRLKDFRRPGHKTNSPLLLSRVAVAALHPPRKPKPQ